MTSKIFWIKCVLCNCSISEQNVNLLEVEENWVFILSQILLSWHIFVFHWNGILWLNYVLLLEWITYLTYLGSEICPLRDQNWGPKLHPRGGLFGPWSFIISKKSHQNLSNGNEGSNLFFEITRSWSLRCSNMAIFWRITWNYRYFLEVLQKLSKFLYHF